MKNIYEMMRYGEFEGKIQKLNVCKRMLLVLLALCMLLADILLFCFEKVILGMLCLLVVVIAGALLYKSCK